MKSERRKDIAPLPPRKSAAQLGIAEPDADTAPSSATPISDVANDIAQDYTPPNLSPYDRILAGGAKPSAPSTLASVDRTSVPSTNTTRRLSGLAPRVFAKSPHAAVDSLLQLRGARGFGFAWSP